MSRGHLWGLALSLLCGAGLAAPSPAADGLSAGEAVAHLLEVGWQTTPQARQKVDSYVTDLPASAKSEARVQQAYLLVMLKQQRYAEAAKRADALVGRDPQDHLAWHAKIWLSLLNKKYPAALVDIQACCESLPDRAEQAQQTREFQNVGTFLGSLFGFLEGPAGTAVKEAPREACLKAILERLGPAGTEAFQAARRDVQQQYKRLLSEQGLAEVEAEEQAEQKREDLLKDAATERETADKGREQVTEERQKIQEEFRAQMNSLAASERPLQMQFAQAQQNAFDVQAELNRLAADMARLEALLRDLDRQRNKEREREHDRQREQMRGELLRLQTLASRAQAQLAEIQRLGAGVQAQLAEIQQRRLVAQDSYGKQMGLTERELADMKRRDAKAVANEKLARKTTGDKRRASAVGTRAAALTTYAPFPVDEEKQKLLRK